MKTIKSIIFCLVGVIIVIILNNVNINAEISNNIRNSTNNINSLDTYELKTNKIIIANPKEKYDENKVYEELFKKN